MAAWKQFVLALLVLAVAGAAWLFFNQDARQMLAGDGGGTTASTHGGATGEQKKTVNEVIAAPVSAATINDRLSAIGTGGANASVVVNPFVAGRIIELAVQSGERVSVGDVVARLDSDAEKISLDRSILAVADAQQKLERVRALRNANTASAVQFADAEVVLSQARLEQLDAELALERRVIRSPIAGVVGILPIGIGDYVTTQTAIATIDDRSRIKVDFWVPERFASEVDVGQSLTAAPVARPGDTIEGVVIAVDNRLDQTSRTLQVQAAIPNDDDRLRAGMSFQVTMKFAGDTYPSVDPLAIQWGSDGAFVWVVRDGKGKRVPVRIIQRNTESVLVQGELAQDEMVVTQGVHLVRQNADLRIAGGEARALSPATGG